jgi:hypothetical protein
MSESLKFNGIQHESGCFSFINVGSGFSLPAWFFLFPEVAPYKKIPKFPQKSVKSGFNRFGWTHFGPE